MIGWGIALWSSSGTALQSFRIFAFGAVELAVNGTWKMVVGKMFSVRAQIARRIARVSSIAACLAFVGCSGRPSAIAPPDLDPNEVAQAAIDQYDSGGDGAVDSNELKAAPSLRFAHERIDTNDDGKLVAEEFAQFAQKHWVDTDAGIIRIRCNVKHQGRPLDGATVTFEPEAFMQGAVKPASGVTRGGMAVISVSEEDRPHPNARGVQNGLYLVKISKVVNGKETIPDKYNEHTTLGCEVADRASYMPGPVTFNL